MNLIENITPIIYNEIYRQNQNFIINHKHKWLKFQYKPTKFDHESTVKSYIINKQIYVEPADITYDGMEYSWWKLNDFVLVRTLNNNTWGSRASWYNLWWYAWNILDEKWMNRTCENTEQQYARQSCKIHHFWHNIMNHMYWITATKKKTRSFETNTNNLDHLEYIQHTSTL